MKYCDKNHTQTIENFKELKIEMQEEDYCQFLMRASYLLAELELQQFAEE